MHKYLQHTYAKIEVDNQDLPLFYTPIDYVGMAHNQFMISVTKHVSSHLNHDRYFCGDVWTSF